MMEVDTIQQQCKPDISILSRHQQTGLTHRPVLTQTVIQDIKRYFSTCKVYQNINTNIQLEDCLQVAANEESLQITISISIKSDATTQTKTKIYSRETPRLTQRETEVLQLIAKGLSYNDIANTLNMSIHTVTTHTKKIYKKLAVHSRGEAAFEAQQLGLIH